MTNPVVAAILLQDYDYVVPSGMSVSVGNESILGSVGFLFSKTPGRLREAWQSLDLSGAYIGLDFSVIRPISVIHLIGTNLTSEATWRIRADSSPISNYESANVVDDSFHTPPPALPVASNITGKVDDPLVLPTFVTFNPGESYLGKFTSPTGSLQVGASLQAIKVRVGAAQYGGTIRIELWEDTGVPSYVADLYSEDVVIPSATAADLVNTQIYSLYYDASALSGAPMVRVVNTGTQPFNLYCIESIYDISSLAGFDTGWMGAASQSGDDFPPDKKTSSSFRTLSHAITSPEGDALLNKLYQYWRIDLRDDDNDATSVYCGGIAAGEGIPIFDTLTDVQLQFHDYTRLEKSSGGDVVWVDRAGEQLKEVSFRLISKRSNVWGKCAEIFRRARIGIPFGITFFPGIVGQQLTEPLTEGEVSDRSGWFMRKTSDLQYSSVAGQLTQFDAITVSVEEFV